MHGDRQSAGERDASFLLAAPLGDAGAVTRGLRRFCCKFVGANLTG
jgi:hypothetical protein